jgi:hypothetical protein
MGAKPSGQVFTGVVTPVRDIGHHRGIHTSQYLEVWSVKGASKEEVEKVAVFSLWLTEAMGFVGEPIQVGVGPGTRLSSRYHVLFRQGDCSAYRGQ